MAAATKETAEAAPDRRSLAAVALFAAAFVAFGFCVAPPAEIAAGLIRIATAKDTLITDYVGVGGLGAAFVNAGVLALLACLAYRAAAAKITGAAVACLFLVLGFGLFGKNLLNVWCIVAGVFLYSKVRREPFASHINTAFFGAALAPVFSEIMFSTAMPVAAAAPLAVATSLTLGFILPPVAAQLFKAHMGYSLYNIGFAAGVLGTLVVALYKSWGLVPEPAMIWSGGENLRLGGFLAALFVVMIALGVCFDRGSLEKLLVILRQSGQAPADFIATAGIGPAWVNMGLCGAIGLAYVLAVGGAVNGPTTGAIFSLVGFAACGKHPGNITPVMAGVFLGALAKPGHAHEPGFLLAALFGATLAPIAGAFGWGWGILAGFIHSSAAQSLGDLHGGLNLYNNGFAAGMVAAVLAPVILAFRSWRRRDGAPDNGA